MSNNDIRDYRFEKNRVAEPLAQAACTRRAMLTGSLAVAVAPLLLPATGIVPAVAFRDTRGRQEIAKLCHEFMRQYEVPGMSVALAYKGQMQFAEGFGVADRDSRKRATANSLYRIASLSKPITAVAIFKLVETGKLRLNDRVFGRDGILGRDFPKLADRRATAITVDQLLTHTSGLWTNDGADPMFQSPTLSATQLIAQTMQSRRLNAPPGQLHAYSNFGFCVLGRVIEKVTGQPYERYVRSAILGPSGARDMRIAGNTVREQQRGEVRYYSPTNWNPYSINVRRMDAHGGWIASAPDLVRFLTRVDQFGGAPDILSSRSINQMWRGTRQAPGYGRGWNVNQSNNRWHNGALPGSTTIMVRANTGFCWAALANSWRQGSDISLKQDQLMWKLAAIIQRGL